MADDLRIFFFGDSVCFGQGISIHKTWVCRLSAALTERFGGERNVITQNPSVNGNTSRMALERMPFDVQSHRPHVLLVQFGLNDCNVWQTDNGHPRVSARGFAANLAEIIDRGRRSGAEQIVLGTNHSTTRTIGRLADLAMCYEDHNRAYNQIVRDVAQTTDVRLVDIEAAFDARTAAGVSLGDLLLPDELHLSEAGHAVYFDTYRQPVVEAVEQAVRARV